MTPFDIELYDKDHAIRVADLTQQIALALGLRGSVVSMLGMAGLLHDIGKTDIPLSILNKPGELTQDEWAIMRQHGRLGYDRIQALPLERCPCLRDDARMLCAIVALQHHERLDGSGYMGMTDVDISYSARIVAVADVFDAFSHDRPYRKAWPLRNALHAIYVRRGIEFEPAIVDALLEVVEGEEDSLPAVAGNR